MKLRAVAFSLTLSMHAYAADLIDLYGTNNTNAERIIQKYAKRVTAIETAIGDTLSKERLTSKPSTQRDALRKEKKALIAEIKKNEGLSFVTIETIDYTDKPDRYTTIEVIEKNQPHRLKLATPQPKPQPLTAKHDLINSMMVYGELSIKLIYAHQINEHVLCPVYHCTSGFNHPQLKPYLSLFNTGVIKEKKLILATLKHDQDPERRAAAAFLVGHFNDPHEIIAVLSPYVNDPDDGVRNNVIRVIGTTVEKAHLANIDAVPFLTLLDSPFVTDRNKSLYVLLAIADSKANRQLIIQKGSTQLLALLQLKQPINHNLAYLILKKVSGKKYGEHDILAWRTWLSMN